MEKAQWLWMRASVALMRAAAAAMHAQSARDKGEAERALKARRRAP
jgi:hypothetical protein